MTSANFHISYASVANALFEHIEQDLLALTTAFLDDDEELPTLHHQRKNVVPAQAGTQDTMRSHYIERGDYSSRLGFLAGAPSPARERRAYDSDTKGV